MFFIYVSLYIVVNWLRPGFYFSLKKLLSQRLQNIIVIIPVTGLSVQSAISALFMSQNIKSIFAIKT